MKHRLIVIINRFVIGGQAADTIPLLYQLKEKYDIKILYGEKEADEIEPLYLLDQYPGLDIKKVASLRRSINPFVDLITLFRLYKHIRNYKPNIVHTHGAKSGLLGRLAARIWGKAVIVHTFHGHLFHSYFNSITTKLLITIERSMAKISDAAIALSLSQKTELVQQYKIVPEKKVFVISLGMAQPQINATEKQELRSIYKVSPDDVIIAIVGRIVPIKNHLEFLNIAFAVLETGATNTTFLIIGDGNDKGLLEEFLRQKGHVFSKPGDVIKGSRFIFTSWISDMYSVMDELDIVVLTSSNEGTPVSLIEAQLCGKPVVAYNVGGVKDTFINDESGYLVDRGDIQGFSTKLLMLVNDKSLREQMGERGKVFAATKYSKQTEVAAIDKLYDRLLKQNIKERR